MRIAQTGIALCLSGLALLLLGCSGMGWVSVSPDGKYVTFVGSVPDQEDDRKELDLRLYNLQTGESTSLIVLDLENRWIGSCQWSPDSRKIVFSVIDDVKSEQKMRLYMYDLSTQQFAALPIEDAGTACWSADGRYLLAACITGAPTVKPQLYLNWHRVSDWNRVHSVAMPKGLQHASLLQWAVGLTDEQFHSFVHLATQLGTEGNLYRVRGNNIKPLTTTGDVTTFWVAPAGDRMRWARAKPGRFIAVFERDLTTDEVRRLRLLDSSEESIAEGYAYRFSPGGVRLAWHQATGVYLLDISTGELLRIVSSFPVPKDGSIKLIQDWDGVVGFDWRDDDTLIVQRSNRLDVHTMRDLWK